MAQASTQPQSKWIGPYELRLSGKENRPPSWQNTQFRKPGCTRIDAIHLLQITDLSIVGKIDANSLVKNTNYGAFLVFKLRDDSTGLDQAMASVRFLNDQGNCVDCDASSKPVFIAKKKTRPNENGQFSHVRPDEWMEIKLGEFYVEDIDDGVVQMQLKSTTPDRKSGLIVRGIEIRPT